MIVNLKLMNRRKKILYFYKHLYVDLLCRISSEHNAATVAKVEEAIGTTNFAPVLILSMNYRCVYMVFLRSYNTLQKDVKLIKRPCIAVREKQASPVKRQKLVRSLKQRVSEQ